MRPTPQAGTGRARGALAAATEATVRGCTHWLRLPKLSVKSGPAKEGPWRSSTRHLLVDSAYAHRLHVSVQHVKVPPSH